MLKNKSKATSIFGPTKLGTFSGVFLNDFLTILGVIMYLRLSWVVGEVGLLGAIVIIIISKTITLATGLSMSAITTNIKIGSGGAYSIISKSLGYEAGGSIGIPLYLSQTFSTALYIFGFTETWIRLFPHHNFLVVSLITTILIIIIAYLSTNMTIKFQITIMIIIILSLISFYLTPSNFLEINKVNLWSSPEEGYTFWKVYSIFFPAVTGILAGASLSGDLKNPRENIPKGTLWAIGITFIIYVSLAVMFAFTSTREELLTNTTIIIDKARIPALVIAGIMGATISSAIGSILSAPRVLQAMAEDKIIPFSNFFSNKSKSGEPRNAIVFTGLIVIITLILGKLNSIATIITMFFLITYGMLNIIVFIEEYLDLITYRPSIKVPKYISLFGAIACFSTMFLINNIFSIIALISIIVIYIYLLKKEKRLMDTDIRSGIIHALAEKSSQLAKNIEKTKVVWTPNVLIVGDHEYFKNCIDKDRRILVDIFGGKKTNIFMFDFNEKKDDKIVNDLKNYFPEFNIIPYGCSLNSSLEFGTETVLTILDSILYKPNILFINLCDNKKEKIEKWNNIIKITKHHKLGIVIYKKYDLSNKEKVENNNYNMEDNNINLWLRDRTPNKHLAILLSIMIVESKLNKQDKLQLNLITVEEKEEDFDKGEEFLNSLIEEARLPSSTTKRVIIGNFKEALEKAPPAKFNIFGLNSYKIDDIIFKISDIVKTDVLFMKDSGQEDAFI